MASPSTHNILSPLLMGALARAVDRLSFLSDDEVGVNFPSDAVTTGVHIIHSLVTGQGYHLGSSGKVFQRWH